MQNVVNCLQLLSNKNYDLTASNYTLYRRKHTVAFRVF